MSARTSVRMELVQLLDEEYAYRNRAEVGYAPGNWARAAADVLADGNCFGGPPRYIEGESARASEVLGRWSRMHARLCMTRARRIFA